MHVKPSTHPTRDGRGYAVRSARDSDSGRVLDFVWTIHSREPGMNHASAEELDLTVDHMRGIFRRLRGADNSIFLLAEAARGVIGTLWLEGGRYRKTRHDAELGVSVHRDWRRQGVARTLIRTAAAAARTSGVLRRLSLKVFSGNAPALQLYESLGFVVEGRRRDAILIGDRLQDEILMSLSLSEPRLG